MILIIAKTVCNFAGLGLGQRVGIPAFTAAIIIKIETTFDDASSIVKGKGCVAFVALFMLIILATR